MKSQKKVTVVFGIIFAAAVLFFIAILVLAGVEDGTADATQKPDHAITITEMRVDIVWNNDRSCSVTQKLNVLYNKQRHGIYVDIPVNSGERVRGLKVSVKNAKGYSVPYGVEHESNGKIVRITVGSSTRYFNKGDKLDCTINYNYLTPVHPDGNNLLDINAIGYGWACEISSATVNVTFPAAVSEGDLSAWVGGNATKSYEISSDGKTVSLQAKNLGLFKGLRVKAEMPSGVLKSGEFEGLTTIIIGIVIAVAAVLLMVFLGKDKPLAPIVGFYPPYTDGKSGKKRRMLPVQLGKIIDGTCSGDDVTSLIFYWASEGYIAIKEGEADTYLIKLKEIDPVTEYERNLFNALFKNGKRFKSEDDRTLIQVGVGSLSGKFSSKIETAKAAVNREFGSLYRVGFTVLSVSMAVIAALFAIFVSMSATTRIFSGYINIIGVITFVPVVLAYVLGILLVRTYFKINDVWRKVFLVLFFVTVILASVAVMLSVPTDAMGWMEKIIYAACIGITSALAPFLTRRTDAYTEKLNDVIGFRNFLRDAEKDRLETLLADDPQYYYNILPYANVLGVSDIWQNKFAGLQLEPPTYYYGGGRISVFDIYVISRLAGSIGSSLTYTPPSASSGSFSGGHGGGHFGGGGSFGGFGGGGGGSW